MRISFAILAGVFPFLGYSQYAPAADQVGTTAIHKDSSVIISWATHVVSFNRGFKDIAVGTTLASYGDSTAALGMAEGTSTDAVSLGDAGEIILGFLYPIKNGIGPDFAVFENSFNHDYLEFAHVEVSTDGIRFVRIPSYSVTQTATQTGGFGSTLAEWVHNLAGKYTQGYGTPFNLDDIADSSGINLDSINYVKIIDVVGSINTAYGSYDSQGTIINDPYPSAYASGGFDLDAIAVIHENNIFASSAENEINFAVYPNPTNGVLNVSNYHGTYEIFDLSGRICGSGELDATSLVDLKGFTPGVYLLKCGKELRTVMLSFD
jgi:hypothetical protein